VQTSILDWGGKCPGTGGEPVLLEKVARPGRGNRRELDRGSGGGGVLNHQVGKLARFLEKKRNYGKIKKLIVTISRD